MIKALCVFQRKIFFDAKYFLCKIFLTKKKSSVLVDNCEVFLGKKKLVEQSLSIQFLFPLLPRLDLDTLISSPHTLSLWKWPNVND